MACHCLPPQYNEQKYLEKYTFAEKKKKKLMSSSKMRIDGPRPLLADIVFFEIFLLGFPSRFLKHVC